jgi:adenylate kinase
MIVVLLGPPGVGKGTQARILSDRYGLTQVSTGDMIRAEVNAGTDLGREARKYLDHGNLVPDDVILKMVEEKMRSRPEGNFLLDGFPRTIAQAQGLDRILGRLGKQIKAVLCIDVSEELVVSRLSNRRTCPVDGRVYNLMSQRPSVNGYCDEHPGIELVLRSDDKPETVRHRFEVYHGQTRPLAEYYRNRSVLKDIDGEGTVEQVTSRIEAALKMEEKSR